MKPVDDMDIFVRVVERASLSAAGRDLRVSAAVVSHRIARLEERLGVRLLNRTTRHVRPTAEGSIYYDHCRRILHETERVESDLAAQRAVPRGILKVTTPAAFGRIHVAPLVPEFLDRHPEVELRLQLTDGFVDILAEGIDVAIRVADLHDSSLIARKLAPDRRLVVAAPSYLERFGEPHVPDDLRAHECLLLRFPGSRQFQWTFDTADGPLTVPVRGRMDSNDGAVLHDWCLAGHGLALKSTWEVRDDLAAGRLRTVLPGHPPRAAAIHAVFPYDRYTPPRVRAFVDFLAQRFAPVPPWERQGGEAGRGTMQAPASKGCKRPGMLRKSPD